MVAGEMKALGDLAGRTFGGPAELARGVHEAVARRTFGVLGVLGLPARTMHDGISRATYGSVSAALRAPLRLPAAPPRLPPPNTPPPPSRTAAPPPGGVWGRGGGGGGGGGEKPPLAAPGGGAWGRRAPCHYGDADGHDWTRRVRHVFCLGTPHL